MQHKLTGDDNGYGLAIETVKDFIPGKTMKGHNGSAYGLFSIMFFQPREKFGIVAITNGCAITDDTGYNVPLKTIGRILYNEIIE
jgi:hypothetical protein